MNILILAPFYTNNGIRTYSEQLLSSLKDLYSNDNFFEFSTSNLYKQKSTSNFLAQLKKMIDDHNIDLIHLQFDYGYVSRPLLQAIILLIGEDNLVLTVHRLFENPQLLEWFYGLKVIVHQQEGVEYIQKKTSKIKPYFIHHGVSSLHPQSRPKISTPSLIHFGFGLDYKGWEESFKLHQELRRLGPDFHMTFLIGVNDESQAKAQNIFTKLHSIQNQSTKIELFRGNTQELSNIVGQHHLALFPYLNEIPEHDFWGASGALRLALRWQLTCLCSQARIFNDVDNVCLQFSHFDDFVQSTVRFIETPDLYDKSDQITAFTSETNWSKIAEKHMQVYDP